MKYLLSVVLILTLLSCKPSVEPINNYKESLVHYKGVSIMRGNRFLIERDSIFISVYVTKYDFQRFEIGDTIK